MASSNTVKYIKLHKKDKLGNELSIPNLVSTKVLRIIHTPTTFSNFNIIEISDRGNFVFLQVESDELSTYDVKKYTTVYDYPSFSKKSNSYSLTDPSATLWKMINPTYLSGGDPSNPDDSFVGNKYVFGKMSNTDLNWKIEFTGSTDIGGHASYNLGITNGTTTYLLNPTPFEFNGPVEISGSIHAGLLSSGSIWYPIVKKVTYESIFNGMDCQLEDYSALFGGDACQIEGVVGYYSVNFEGMDCQLEDYGNLFGGDACQNI